MYKSLSFLNILRKRSWLKESFVFSPVRWSTKTEKVSTCDSLQWLSGCVLPGIPRNSASRERSYKNILLVTGKANTMDNCFNTITLGYLRDVKMQQTHSLLPKKPFIRRKDKVKTKTFHPLTVSGTEPLLAETNSSHKLSLWLWTWNIWNMRKCLTCKVRKWNKSVMITKKREIVSWHKLLF